MAYQRGVFSGEFFWNQFRLVLEDLCEFLWVLDGTDKNSYEVVGCFSSALLFLLTPLILKIWLCKLLFSDGLFLRELSSFDLYLDFYEYFALERFCSVCYFSV